MKKTIFKIIHFMLISKICFSQGTNIAANYDNPKCNNKTLSLFEYNSAFDLKLIKTKTSINGLVTFKRNNTEPNTYILEDSESKMAIMFVWDNDLVIDLNCDDMSESIVKNSPETVEFKKTNKLKYDLYILPLKKMDSLVSSCKDNKLTSTLYCDSLNKQRNEFANTSQKKFKEFIINYIKNNPDSFTSLHFLTLGGDEIPPEEEYVKAFENISERLKRHKRSKIYTSNIK